MEKGKGEPEFHQDKIYLVGIECPRTVKNFW